MARGRRGTAITRPAQPRFEDLPVEALPVKATFGGPDFESEQVRIDVSAAFDNLAYAYVDLTSAMRGTEDPAYRDQLHRARLAVKEAGELLGMNVADHRFCLELL